MNRMNLARFAAAALAVAAMASPLHARDASTAGLPTSTAGVPASVASAKEAGATSKSVYSGFVVFTCVNADAAGNGPHLLNRDNTGVGQESLRVDIRDGNNTLIFTLSFSNVLGNFAGGIGDFFYTTPPAANPITFTLTSLAGNGLPEQIDFVAQGVCPALVPTVPVPVGGPGVIALLAVLLALAAWAFRHAPVMRRASRGRHDR